MKIDKCGWYRRRDGGKARVVCVDAPSSNYPVVVVGEKGDLYTTTADGLNITGNTGHSDLIAPWTDEPEKGSLEWVRTLPPETRIWVSGTSPNDSCPAKWLVENYDLSKPSDAKWHIVGTAEWANALPEGTKVRWHKWEPRHYIYKENGTWFHSIPGGVAAFYQPIGSDWELYTEPALRPWKPEEVPIGAWIRRNTEQARTASEFIRCLLVAVSERGVTYFTNDGMFADYDRLLAGCEHSIDGGKTWRPCGVEESR